MKNEENENEPYKRSRGFPGSSADRGTPSDHVNTCTVTVHSTAGRVRCCPQEYSRIFLLLLQQRASPFACSATLSSLYLYGAFETKCVVPSPSYPVTPDSSVAFRSNLSSVGDCREGSEISACAVPLQNRRESSHRYWRKCGARLKVRKQTS